MRITIGLLTAAVLASSAAAQTRPVPAASASAPAAPAAEKVRCKRYTETGSLAKITRVCHTVAEWDQIQRQGRADSEAYQQQGASDPSKN